MNDLEQAINEAVARSNRLDDKIATLEAKGASYGIGNVEFDELCDQAQALDHHIQSLQRELTLQKDYAEYKRLRDIACAHVPHTKWPNEKAFNKVRETMKALYYGTSGRKFTKQEIIEQAQDWKNDILATVTNEYDEMELLTPYILYNMAQDLPD